MNLNSTTLLKWGVAIFAMFWTCGMLWRTGATGPVDIFILAFCGAAGSCGWYQAMCFAFRRFGLLPPERDETVEARRGKIYPWMVFVGAMMATQLLTVCLLDRVNPLIPAGEWHQLTRSMFIIFVWPGLMWSLRPIIWRHLPSPKKGATKASTPW